MIDVHLYGHLRKIVPGSKANEDTILLIESEEGESFQDLVERLGFEISNIGDCFINGRLAITQIS